MKQDNISSKLEEAYDVYLNEQEIEIPQPDLSFLKKEEKKFMPDWRMVSKVAIIALVILVSSTGIGIWLNSDSAVATKFAVEKVFYEMSNGFFPQMKNLI